MISYTRYSICFSPISTDKVGEQQWLPGSKGSTSRCSPAAQHKSKTYGSTYIARRTSRISICVFTLRPVNNPF